MLQAFTLPPLLHYLRTSHHINTDNINLSAYVRAKQKLKPINCFTTKVSFQWLPTAAKLNQQQSQHDPVCP